MSYLMYLMETVISASSIGFNANLNLSDNQSFTTGPWKAYHGEDNHKSALCK